MMQWFLGLLAAVLVAAFGWSSHIYYRGSMPSAKLVLLAYFMGCTIVVVFWFIAGLPLFGAGHTGLAQAVTDRMGLWGVAMIVHWLASFIGLCFTYTARHSRKMSARNSE